MHISCVAGVSSISFYIAAALATGWAACMEGHVFMVFCFGPCAVKKTLAQPSQSGPGNKMDCNALRFLFVVELLCAALGSTVQVDLKSLVTV